METAVKVYTYQIGPAQGDGSDLEFISHAETIYAEDLVAAIAEAREITIGRPSVEKETRVRLLEELDGDSIIMWFRPVGGIRHT